MADQDFSIKLEDEDEEDGFVNISRPKEPGDLYALHPLTKLLTISDLESCCLLEKEAFEKPEERCSDEKFKYRLRTCGELSLGLFTTATPGALNAATMATGRPVETGREDGAIGVLMAHIVATKSMDVVVTDEAMDYPLDWECEHPVASAKGHRGEGRTICLHSLAVLPNFQGKSLGRTLLMAYTDQMDGTGIADRISLIAHEHLVPFYESCMFVNKGPSKAQFGGGNWIDMVYDLKPEHPRKTGYGVRYD